MRKKGDREERIKARREREAALLPRRKALLRIEALRAEERGEVRRALTKYRDGILRVPSACPTEAEIMLAYSEIVAEWADVPEVPDTDHPWDDHGTI